MPEKFINNASSYITQEKENFKGIEHFDDKVLKIFPLWIEEKEKSKANFLILGKKQIGGLNK